MKKAATDKNAGLVRLGDLARGAIAGLPDTPSTLRGVGTLLRARFARSWSLGAQLERQAARFASRPALLHEDRRWTYAEFNAWANRLAAEFAHAGVKAGDCVALLAENHPAVLACVAALAKLGAIAGMLNPNLRGEALRHSVATMKPVRLVVAGECREAWQDLARDWPLQQLYTLRGYGEPLAGAADLDARAAKQPDGNPASTGQVATAARLYYILTSGTTGMPKASVMTHRRWLRAMGGMGQLAMRLREDDVLYCALPLYHNNALTVSWGAALGTGAALALDRKFSATRFWDRVRHYDATAFTYIGELCRYLLAQPASARDREHRIRVCIGNGLRPDVWLEFKQRFGIERICEFYGASEGNLVFVNAFNADATAGYCPYPYAVVACDPDSAEPQRNPKGWLEKVGTGGVGLLITEVTDGAPFDGYTDARAGESRLIRNAFARGDCWFNTGDLVRDQGWKHIAFMDRLGDTFRWKGENVATTEVEGVLMHAPGIADATVYGVQLSGYDGRAGMGAVCVAPGAVLDGTVLATHLRERLPAYAVPLFLRVVDHLETTATFKTRKQDLKREGADPAKVSDPLYVLWPGADGYVPLDFARWQALQSKSVRL